MKRHTRFLALSMALLTMGGLLVATIPAPVDATSGRGQKARRRGTAVSRPEAKRLRRPAQEMNGQGEAEDETKVITRRPTAAQGDRADVSEAPVVVQAARFAVSQPVSAIKAGPVNTDSIRKNNREEAEDERISPPGTDLGERDGALAPSRDAGPTPGIEPKVLATPDVTFEGNSNAQNGPVFGFTITPPDTTGDVGLTQYVQATNLLFRVFDKNTGAPQTPALPVSSLFTSLGGRCAARDDGDPVVLYDGFANRWFISQFIAGGDVPFAQCIAISRTSDATGAYNTYEFSGPNELFGDYPHYGVWSDGYYGTVNQFRQTPLGNVFEGVGAYAYDRTKMLRGDPTASYVYFDFYPTYPTRGGMLPSDADGLLPPPAGAPNTFALFDANEFGAATDCLILYDFHADFATPSNSTFTKRPESPLTVAPFNPLDPPGRADIEQPPPATTASYLDSIQDRLLQRFQYRNFGSYEGLTVTHTVNVGTGTTVATHQSGIRYYELRRTSPASPLTVREQSTFSPDLVNNRWMGSAAMDNQGNLAVGYSVSGTATFPSIRYAGRLVNDPNGLAQGEKVLQNGGGSQTSTGDRWGDYSALSVDPVDDCTFYYTNEYYAASSTGGWQTRVGRFKFTECTAPQKGTIAVSVIDCATGAPLGDALVSVNGNVFGATLPDGTFTATVPPGTYTVTVSSPGGYNTATNQNVTVTNGGTAVINNCLTASPVIVNAGLTLSAESCSTANGVVDPNERVTARLTLRNDGGAATSNLVATLQPSSDVINPTGPQSYGALARGASATRDFSFTAGGSCGGTITLTFQLQDGATNLGTLNVTLRLGTESLTTVFSENFDGATAPALPSGWTTDTTGAGVAWTTTSQIGFADVPPDATPSPTPFKAAATTAPGATSDSRLNSPVINVPAGSPARLSFRHFYNTEVKFDGGVLEIKIGGGTFQDIIAAGGSFVSGGYNSQLVVPSFSTNPLAGRQAWTGNSGGFITTAVNLPASALGQSVQFRWRLGTDSSTSPGNGGWRVDNVVLSGVGTACCTVPTSTVKFGSPIQTNVLEDSTAITLPVTRTGETASTLTVNYTTADGTASDRTDYEFAAGKLTFGPGETDKAITVLINEDSIVEPDETFSVILSNPTSSAPGNVVSLGSPSSVTVTIQNEATEPPGNQIDDTISFVRQHYHDFLNREPDTSGLNFWVNNIESCGADANCRATKRVETSAAFFLSIEFQQTGYIVYRTYGAAFGRTRVGGTVPLTLQEFLPDTQQISRGIIVGQGNWEAQVNANKAAFFLDFVQRPAFVAAYPTTLTPAQFVDQLNANAGSPLSQAERDALVTELSANYTTDGRASALRRVVEDADFAASEVNKAFVLMQYFGYLRRNPNDPPDTDYSGYTFWLTKLNSFNGDFRKAEMVKAFLESIEYRRRFGNN